MKSTSTEALGGDAPGGGGTPADSPGAKVADRTWQRRVLLFDGLLIALLGWLLWTLYTERGTEPITPPQTQLEVDAPAVGGDAPDESAPE